MNEQQQIRALEEAATERHNRILALEAEMAASRAREADLRAGLASAIRCAERHIHSEYDGTMYLDELLAELDDARAALAAQPAEGRGCVRCERMGLNVPGQPQTYEYCPECDRSTPEPAATSAPEGDA